MLDNLPHELLVDIISRCGTPPCLVLKACRATWRVVSDPQDQGLRKWLHRSFGPKGALWALFSVRCVGTWPEGRVLASLQHLLSCGCLLADQVQTGCALYWAAKRGMPLVLEALLEHVIDTPTTPGLDRWLHNLLVSASGDTPSCPQVVQVLLARGADPNCDGGRPLVAAAEAGHHQVVGLLLGVGADAHVREECALRVAAAGGHAEVVRLLLGAGADPHVHHGEPLALAVERGHAGVVSTLLEHNANPRSRQVLELAAAFGNVEILQLLLSSGALQTAPSLQVLGEQLAAAVPAAAARDEQDVELGLRALQAACVAGQRGAAELLLAAGVDVNASEGAALESALVAGHADVAAVLLRSGARVTERVVSNWRQYHRYPHVMELLHGYDMRAALRWHPGVRQSYHRDSLCSSTGGSTSSATVTRAGLQQQQQQQQQQRHQQASLSVYEAAGQHTGLTLPSAPRMVSSASDASTSWSSSTSSSSASSTSSSANCSQCHSSSALIERLSMEDASSPPPNSLKPPTASSPPATSPVNIPASPRSHPHPPPHHDPLPPSTFPPTNCHFTLASLHQASRALAARLQRELAAAAAEGSEQALRLFLAWGADPAGDGSAALHEAAVVGHVACVQLLLAAGARAPALGPATLHAVVRDSNYEVLRLLMDAGALIGSSGALLLCSAACSRRCSGPMVRRLLDHGAASAAVEALRLVACGRCAAWKEDAATLIMEAALARPCWL